jgi:hypothetical protein
LRSPVKSAGVSATATFATGLPSVVVTRPETVAFAGGAVFAAVVCPTASREAAEERSVTSNSGRMRARVWRWRMRHVSAERSGWRIFGFVSLYCVAERERRGKVRVRRGRVNVLQEVCRGDVVGALVARRESFGKTRID